MVIFLRGLWSNLTEALEQFSNYAGAMLRGCWRKFTEPSVNINSNTVVSLFGQILLGKRSFRLQNTRISGCCD